MSTVKLVRDVMVEISDYPRIQGDITLKQAIKIIRSSMISDEKCIKPLIALIFDGNKLIGTLRLRDILKGLEPSFLKSPTKVQGYFEDRTELSIIWDSLFNEESEKLAARPVKAIMNPTTMAVNHNDSIIKAAHMMINNDLLVLPVLAEEKKLLGLVRMIELFDEIANRILVDEKDNLVHIRKPKVASRSRLRNPVV